MFNQGGHFARQGNNKPCGSEELDSTKGLPNVKRRNHALFPFSFSEVHNFCRPCYWAYFVWQKVIPL